MMYYKCIKIPEHVHTGKLFTDNFTVGKIYKGTEQYDKTLILIDDTGERFAMGEMNKKRFINANLITEKDSDIINSI